MAEQSVYFGYRRVDKATKAREVNRIFSAVASRYDLMNDAMSLGLHRVWKRVAVNMCAVRSEHAVLDLAGGSGDMSVLLRRRFGSEFDLTIADINRDMLNVGFERLANRGLWPGVDFVQCDATDLPFADESFDRVLVAFGLRNFSDAESALREARRVLRRGGRLIILEFSRVNECLQPLYDRYSFALIPFLGRRIVGDEDGYRYLVESIRTHPDADALQKMCKDAGFDDCDYLRLSQGIVAIHRARRALKPSRAERGAS